LGTIRVAQPWPSGASRGLQALPGLPGASGPGNAMFSQFRIGFLGGSRDVQGPPGAPRGFQGAFKGPPNAFISLSRVRGPFKGLETL